MKLWLKILLALLLVFLFMYLYFAQTHGGRVLSMYVFGGIVAPLEVKMGCIKETDAKVIEKFKLPLQFDEESKNALREYWHFSYYRDCLFQNGYTFHGDPFQESSISSDVYTNYFGNFTFSVPAGSIISSDNISNPDIEDRRISSILIINDTPIEVLFFRTFDETDSFSALKEDLKNFSTTTGSVSTTTPKKTASNLDVLKIEQTDGYIGFATINKDNQVVQVFGKELDENILENMISSFSFNENKD